MERRRHKGFTLMEMLIVVAIIAILVAIAIPTFTSALESAREATCAANRRSLKGVLSAVYMTEGEGAVEPYYQEHQGEYTCPAGGEIAYSLGKNGVITVTCSIHEPGKKNLFPGVADALDILEKVSKDFTYTDPNGEDYAFKKAYVGYISQTGEEFSKVTAEEALKKFEAKKAFNGNLSELAWVGVKMQFGSKKEMRTFLVATSVKAAQSTDNPDFKGFLLYDPETGAYYRSTKVTSWNGAVDYANLQWKSDIPLKEFLEHGGSDWERVPD